MDAAIAADVRASRAVRFTGTQSRVPDERRLASAASQPLPADELSRRRPDSKRDENRLTYEAVTDSVKDEASRSGPTAFLVLSWRQLLFPGQKRIGSNGNASCPHLIRDSHGCRLQLRPFVVPWN
jgi:hypothetical protein